jgi:hypothetical protein
MHASESAISSQHSQQSPFDRELFKTLDSRVIELYKLITLSALAVK